MQYALVPALGALILLSACSAETAAPADTMVLLRAGDSRVCVAADVEETLRSLIRPKSFNAAGYSIDFKTTSLQSFDQNVEKAVCSTSVSITGPEGSIVDEEHLAFEITGDARSQANFIITARTADLGARLAEAAESAASVKAAREADEAERSRLEALIKPRWLIGRWVGQEEGSNACVRGPYLEFARRNVFRSTDSQGSWRLVGTNLQMISPSRSSTIEITQAEEMSFSYWGEEEALNQYRRCTSDDVRQAAADAEPEKEPVQEQPEESGNM